MSTTKSKIIGRESDERKSLYMTQCPQETILPFDETSILHMYSTCNGATLASRGIDFAWSGVYLPQIFHLSSLAWNADCFSSLDNSLVTDASLHMFNLPLSSIRFSLSSLTGSRVWQDAWISWTGNLHLFYRQYPKAHRRCISYQKEGILLAPLGLLLLFKLYSNKVGRVWAPLLRRQLDRFLFDELASSRSDLIMDRKGLGNHYLNLLMFLYRCHHRNRCAIPESVDCWFIY